jgi:hypothetical protein
MITIELCLTVELVFSVYNSPIEIGKGGHSCLKGLCLEMNIILSLIIINKYFAPVKFLSNFDNPSSNPLQRP